MSNTASIRLSRIDTVTATISAARRDLAHPHVQIGRDYSLKTTGANRPMGQIYCKAFGAWLAKCGFGSIEKSVRSAALDLVEHLAEIEAWRATLSENGDGS